MPAADSGSLGKMVTEVGSLVGQYRWACMGLGTASDGAQLRKELGNLRSSALRACDSAANAVLPQLRAEASDGSAEFTKHASQFIACLSMFQAELGRTKDLVGAFPEDEGETENIARDEAEVEAMLESLENLITVHFSTKGSEAEPLQPPRPRRKGCNFASLCSSLKTNYA